MSDRERPVARRSRSRAPRCHTLGPLRFNGEEWAAVQRAAHDAGLAPGAWAAGQLVRVAHQELMVIPVDDRSRMQELAQLRAALIQLANQVQGLRSSNARTVEGLLRKISGAVERVQHAADAVTEAQIRRRYRRPA